MEIRALTHQDTPACVALMQLLSERGEILYKPVTEDDFNNRFFGECRWGFGAFENGALIGFAHASAKTSFLNKENAANTPLYLTLVMVHPDHRLKGVGTALIDRIKALRAELGKPSVTVTDMNPVRLTWLIPGANGHDHNNAPGVDEDGMGYPFLLKQGFEARMHEVAMYVNLATYEWNPEMDAIMEFLKAEGIYVGVWQVGMGEEFDGMCDRVGSEYWRNVLRQEIAAWKENRPNSDPDLWVDGIAPTGPRPILVAMKDEHIIGFTGPVGCQQSGRGWFTGICVDPNYGGKGIGSVLFNMLMREFIGVGAQFSSLFTGTTNHAQKIYRRAGFAPHARWAVMRYTEE